MTLPSHAAGAGGRRRFLVGGSAACAAGAWVRFPADAAEFAWKIGNDQPASHPMSVRAQLAADKIKHDSNGRMTLDVFSANQLGNATAMISQVRSGALHLTQVSNGILQQLVPLTAIQNVPFAFAGYKQAFEAMKGPLGGLIRDAISKAGLYAFESSGWTAGFQEIVTGPKAIAAPPDLKGFRIRVAPGQLYVLTLRALDASPVPLEFPEVYPSLQSHLIDGVMVSFALIELAKFYEVQKYVAMVNLFYGGYTLVASNDVWQTLPPQLREIATRHLNEQGNLEGGDMQRLDLSIEDKLRRRGMTITHPDHTSFRAVLRTAGLYTQLRERFGASAWTAFEKAVGNMA